MPNAMIAGDLVRSAMRLVGVLATGETPNADEMQDGLATLNDVLENLSLENISVWQQSPVTFNTSPGQASYTIGPTGQWIAPRPVRIASVYTRVQGVDFAVDSLGPVDYDLLHLKGQRSLIATHYLYAPDAPNGTLTLYPVPDAVTPVTLRVDRVLTTPVVQTTPISGPPGWAKLLRYVLAVELAPEYGIEPPSAVVAVAGDAKADFKRANQTRRLMRADAALSGMGC